MINNSPTKQSSQPTSTVNVDASAYGKFVAAQAKENVKTFTTNQKAIEKVYMSVLSQVGKAIEMASKEGETFKYFDFYSKREWDIQKELVDAGCSLEFSDWAPNMIARLRKWASENFRVTNCQEDRGCLQIHWGADEKEGSMSNINGIPIVSIYSTRV